MLLQENDQQWAVDHFPRTQSHPEEVFYSSYHSDLQRIGQHGFPILYQL